LTGDLSLSVGLETLIRRLATSPPGKRVLVAVAGAPGSGKSTLASHLAVGLNRLSVHRAAILPMDGFHYDDSVLSAVGRLQKKGAPDTFDVGGLLQMLRRLRANTEETIAVPVFDRELEVSRGAARLIPRSTDIVIVEGNYLLSGEAPWSGLAPMFDTTVLIDVPEATLRERLLRRWRDHGYDPETARRKAERNDLPNGRYVREHSIEPDIILHSQE